MTHDDAYKEVNNSAITRLLDPANLGKGVIGVWIDEATDQCFARRQAEADLADARREVEKLKAGELGDHKVYAVKINLAAAQAREKCLGDVWDMFLTYMQGEDETAEGVRGALASAIRALKQKEEKP